MFISAIVLLIKLFINLKSQAHLSLWQGFEKVTAEGMFGGRGKKRERENIFFRCM